MKSTNQCILFLNFFSFEGFHNFNKEDQTELKNKFDSSTVSRKHKDDKTLSSTSENDAATKAKQSKTEDNNNDHLTSEQHEIRQKIKVCWDFLLEI